MFKNSKTINIQEAVDKWRQILTKTDYSHSHSHSRMSAENSRIREFPTHDIRYITNWNTYLIGASLSPTIYASFSLYLLKIS